MGSSESSSSVPETGPESILESLMGSRDRDISTFLPFLLTLNESDPDPDQPDSDENPSSNSNPEENPSDGSDPPSRRHRRRGDRIILINPLTQGMVVIEGENLRSLVGNITGKNEQQPASKASIEAMPTVQVTEEEEGECAICLDGWKAATMAEKEQEEQGSRVAVAVVKQMPCKHRFHGACIEKWLKIHGSCPVCRFRMPSEDEDDEKKSTDDGETEDDDDAGRRTRRRWGGQRGIWLSFSFGNRGRDSDRDNSDDEEGSSSD